MFAAAECSQARKPVRFSRRKEKKRKREERKTNSFLLTNLLMAGMSTLNRILIFSLPCTNGSVAVSISPYHSSSVSLVTSSFLLPYLSLHMSVHSVLVLMGPSILSESPNVLKEGIAGFSWIPPPPCFSSQTPFGHNSITITGHDTASQDQLIVHPFCPFFPPL
jgi:hypothetical protein